MNTHDKPKTKWVRDLWSHVMIELSYDDLVYIPIVNDDKSIKIWTCKVSDLYNNLAYISKKDAIYATRKSLERHNNQ